MTASLRSASGPTSSAFLPCSCDPGHVRQLHLLLTHQTLSASARSHAQTWLGYSVRYAVSNTPIRSSICCPAAPCTPARHWCSSAAGWCWDRRHDLDTASSYDRVSNHGHIVKRWCSQVARDWREQLRRFQLCVSRKSRVHDLCIGDYRYRPKVNILNLSLGLGRILGSWVSCLGMRCASLLREPMCSMPHIPALSQTQDP